MKVKSLYSLGHIWRQVFPFHGRRVVGSILPALLLLCRWPLKPVMVLQTTETSLESQYWQVWCGVSCLLLNCFFFFTSISSFFALPTQGFARSFGMRLANGERREWIKPIMFSGGLGSIENEHVKKEEAASGRKCWRLMDYDGKINVLRFLSFNLTLDLFTHQKNKCVCVRFWSKMPLRRNTEFEKDNYVHLLSMVLGMEVVKIGGPVYRIGVGGGAASSVQVDSDLNLIKVLHLFTWRTYLYLDVSYCFVKSGKL